jgi:hypothetical protein
MSAHEWDELLRTAPVVPFSGNLNRAVTQFNFGISKQYLFTSAQRNRCNPAGVNCIYLSEGRATALAEYDKYYTNTGNHEPCVFYTGALVAGAMLDLGDPAVAKHFGLTDVDFFQAFRVNPLETPLEQLGRAVDRQHKICAIRFPSDAMHAKPKTGFNIVVFKQALAAPDSLRILGAGGLRWKNGRDTADLFSR